MPKKKKPAFDPDRAISWSQISSFEWDPEQWYETYVLGIRQISRELTFGSYIDKKIQEDPTFLPELPRYKLMQHKMEAKLGGLKIVGLPDGLDLVKFLLADYKTGKFKANGAPAWDQAKAEATGQLKMYLLLVWLTEKITPDKFKCFIHWIPTFERGDFTIQLVEPVKIHTFEVRITMQEVLEFSVHITNTVKKMKAYAEQHP